MQTSFEAGVGALPNEYRFLEMSGKDSDWQCMNLFCLFRVYSITSYLSNSSQLLQEDQNTQRGRTTPPAVTQVAKTVVLTEGVSTGVSWGKICVIIGSILGVIALMGGCILGNVV